MRKSVKISIINTAGDMPRERGNIGGTHYYDAQGNELDESSIKEKYGLYNSVEMQESFEDLCGEYNYDEIIDKLDSIAI